MATHITATCTVATFTIPSISISSIPMGMPTGPVGHIPATCTIPRLSRLVRIQMFLYPTVLSCMYYYIVYTLTLVTV